MRIRTGLLLCVLILSGLGAAQTPAAGGKRDGAKEPARAISPEVEAYLGFISDEEDELQYQLENDEISAAEYQTAKARLGITRDSLVKIARSRDLAGVPELHVLMAAELTQVLADGVEALKGKRAGDTVADRFIFHGTANRGRLFYVLERVPDSQLQ
jgi:hypothetical protein